MNNLIQTITFCKRIGKLTLGFDLVKNAMMTGEACIVLLAKDLSPKTKKEAHYLCGQFEVPVYQTEILLDEFWHLIGKRSGVIAVTEPVFAGKIETILTAESGQTHD